MKEEQINPWALNLASRKKWWMNLLHWQFNWVQIMNQMFSCLSRPYPPKTLQTVISDTGTSSSSLWNQLIDSHWLQQGGHQALGLKQVCSHVTCRFFCILARKKKKKIYSYFDHSRSPATVKCTTFHCQYIIILNLISERCILLMIRTWKNLFEKHSDLPLS